MDRAFMIGGEILGEDELGAMLRHARYAPPARGHSRSAHGLRPGGTGGPGGGPGGYGPGTAALQAARQDLMDLKVVGLWVQNYAQYNPDRQYAEVGGRVAAWAAQSLAVLDQSGFSGIPTVRPYLDFLRRWGQFIQNYNAQHVNPDDQLAEVGARIAATAAHADLMLVQAAAQQQGGQAGGGYSGGGSYDGGGPHRKPRWWSLA